MSKITTLSTEAYKFRQAYYKTNKPKLEEYQSAAKQKYRRNAPYIQISILLIDSPKYASILKEQNLQLLNQHRKLFFEKGEEVPKVIQDIRYNKRNHDCEIRALATLLSVPIMTITQQTAIVTFPVASNSKTDMAQFGTIIELDESLEDGYIWTNKSLCREFKQPSIEAIIARPEEVYEIKNKDFSHAENIYTSDITDEEVQENEFMKEALKVSTKTLSQSKYRVITRTEETHIVPEPTLTPRKQAVRPRIGTVLLKEKDVPTLELRDIVKAQKEDPMCRTLAALVLQRKIPFKIEEKEKKTYMRMIPDLQISQEGILINISIPDEFQIQNARIVCPMSYILYIFHLAHNASFHHGMTKTATYLNRRFWRPPGFGTPGLQNMLKDYLQACAVCPQKKSLHSSPRFKLRIPRVPSKPNQILAIDYYGPLPPSKEYTIVDNIKKPTGRIFKYIFVAVDCYSGMTYLWPTQQATGAYAMDGLLNIFRTQACVEVIRADNGKHFHNTYFIQSLKELGVTVQHILPFCAWTNRAERTMLMLGDAFRVSDTTSINWHQYLPYMEIAINTAYNKSLKTTPYLVHFGRTPKLPIDLIRPNPILKVDYKEVKKPLTYAKELQKLLVTINNIITPRIIAEKFQSHIYADRKIKKERELQIGDICMIRLKLQPHTSPKMQSEWIGYFNIIDIMDTKVTVQTLYGSGAYNIHANLVQKITPDFEGKFTVMNDQMLKYAKELEEIRVDTRYYTPIATSVQSASKGGEDIIEAVKESLPSSLVKITPTSKRKPLKSITNLATIEEQNESEEKHPTKITSETSQKIQSLPISQITPELSEENHVNQPPVQSPSQTSTEEDEIAKVDQANPQVGTKKSKQSKKQAKRKKQQGVRWSHRLKKLHKKNGRTEGDSPDLHTTDDN